MASRKDLFERPELANLALVKAFIDHPCPDTLCQGHELLDMIELPPEAAWFIARLLIIYHYSPAPCATSADDPSPSGQEPYSLFHQRVRYLRTITESVSASCYKAEARKALLDIATLLIVLNQKEPRWRYFLSKKESGSFREAGTEIVRLLGLMIEKWLTDPKRFYDRPDRRVQGITGGMR